MGREGVSFEAGGIKDETMPLRLLTEGVSGFYERVVLSKAHSSGD